MRALLPALCVVLAGCGGFDNDPLRVGEVKGQLSRATTGKAFVAVLGVPESKLEVDGSGIFELKGVVPGSHELLAVGGGEVAAKLEVKIDAAMVLDLGTVPLFPAGEIEILPVAPDHQRLSGLSLTVDGTPWQGIGLNSEGKLEVDGVPRGCWTVAVGAAGLATSSQEVCLDQGELQQVDFSLPRADGNAGSEGCRVTGCEFGYACEQDGACR